ncbi:hypothetical protein BH09PAT4_BH09PAT4_05380 [soil metagenome]
MKLHTLTQKIISIFSDTRFFVVTQVIFGLQASWIALTGLYPQAFDEPYHFGLIQLHAQQWSPFFATQPAGADQYGAVVRDPSMLYHYLLSFVYRVIDMFTHNQTLQIILLRFIGVALIIWAFVLFRRLLLMMGLSRAKANVTILFFSLLPVFPLLAGQLNYDNLLIPVTALTLIWAVRLQSSYRSSGRVDWLLALRLLVAMMLFSTIKYPYLPIFFAIVVYFLPMVWKTRRQIIPGLRKDFMALRRKYQLLYVVSGVVAVWLFAGGIGLNIVRYHQPNPNCEKVISVHQCMEFGPFARDYDSSQKHIHPNALRLAVYPATWANNMMRESFFTVYSYFGADGKPSYYGGQRVPQLAVMGWVWFGICVVGLVGGLRVLWRKPVTRLVLFVSAIYIAILLLLRWQSYYELSYAVAIHGRYLFPVIVGFIGCSIIGLTDLLGRIKRPQLRRTTQAVSVVGVLVTLLVYTQGGGFGTYILYSGDGSFWHQSSLAKSANKEIRNGLRAVVVGQ